MTPSQRVGNIPTEVLVHELGHLVVGLKLGFPEGGIEFTENHPSEVARAHYTRQNVTSIQVIMRTLAAMYSQALCAPESIDEKIRLPITTGNLFSDISVLDPDSPITVAMANHGFIGDWHSVLRESGKGNMSKSDQLTMLQDAHEQLIKLFAPTDLRRIVFLLLDDITAWLHTDDEDIEISDMVIYSISRARALYKKA